MSNSKETYDKLMTIIRKQTESSLLFMIRMAVDELAERKGYLPKEEVESNDEEWEG